MSVFVRASLQGTPKTSPGHVALHHMPSLPMNLQYHFPRLGLQHQTPHLNLQNLKLSTPPLPPCLPPQQRLKPLEPKPLMPLPQAQHFRWSDF